MGEALDRARAILDRRTTVSILVTTDAKGAPEAAVLAAPRLSADGILSGGEEEGVGGRTFRNLRQNSRGAILALDPIVDPRSRDGVRIGVEFLGAEEDGEELKHLTTWLGAFAPGRRIVRRLLFKVLEVDPYRPPAPAESPGAAR
jgi:hypothetical protein